MIGYDLDGTLCAKGPKRPKPYFRQTGPERAAYSAALAAHYAGAELVCRPPGDKPYVIITGRKEQYRPETQQWIDAHGLQPVALLMLDGARTRANMVAHKVAACKEYDVTVYYEDDMAIANAMAKAGVNVALVCWGKKDGNA